MIRAKRRCILPNLNDKVLEPRQLLSGAAPAAEVHALSFARVIVTRGQLNVRQSNVVFDSSPIGMGQQYTLTGAGRADLLGPLKAEGVGASGSIFHLGPFQSESLTLTTARGDSLFVNYNVVYTSSQPGTGRLRFVGTVIASQGTGRFVGVTGSFRGAYLTVAAHVPGKGPPPNMVFILSLNVPAHAR